MSDFCYNYRTDEAALTASPALTTQPLEAVAMADESLNPSVEIWKPVVGCPEYLVSNLGRVKSVLPRKGARAGVNGGLIQGWVKTRDGRPMARLIALRSGKRTITYRLHRLVLDAFVGPCPPGMEGCHNDGNPLNNGLANLRWDTHRANMGDTVLHGTRSLPPVHLGERHHNATLSDADIRAIRTTVIRRGTKALLARRYGVSATTINRILARAVWRHV